MEIAQLKTSLEKQIHNLNNLFELGQKKQKGLINRDNEILVECMQGEELMLHNIYEEEKKRLNLIESIYKQYNIEETQPKTEILCEHLIGKVSDEEIEFLNSAKEVITKITSAIADQNYKNLYLIEQAKSFISQTLNILRSTNNRSMLDRKI